MAEPVVASTMMFCPVCGNHMASNAPHCMKCGAPNALMQKEKSEKDWLVAFLLCLFFGTPGFHRFYVGKPWTALLQILTLGGLGLWTLFDLLMIILGQFKDKKGLPLKR